MEGPVLVKVSKIDLLSKKSNFFLKKVKCFFVLIGEITRNQKLSGINLENIFLLWKFKMKQVICKNSYIIFNGNLSKILKYANSMVPSQLLKNIISIINKSMRPNLSALEVAINQVCRVKCTREEKILQNLAFCNISKFEK